MRYDFRCQLCANVVELTTRNPTTPCHCGGLLRRLYTPFSIASSFQPHFNHSVGQYVRTKTQFESALKRSGDKAGTSYAPIYDPSQCGATDEGMDETARVKRDTGLTAPTTTHFT